MSSRCSSAPRMQRVYTPRVKDGRLSNDSPQAHYYNKTARIANPNPSYHFNPEVTPVKDKKQDAKVSQFQAQQLIDQKINTEEPQKVNMKKELKVNLKRKNAPNEQKTIQGRKLEYPIDQKINNYIQKRPESAQIQRSSSMGSSIHYVDRAMKSSAIKEKKKEFDQKFKTAFGYLLDQNENYLKEKRRACSQRARDQEEIFKIKRPAITTTNKDEFGQKSTPYAQHMDPVAQTVANSFGPRKVCGNSTSNQFHNGRTGPRAELAEWPDHYKLQGPIYSVTTYGNKFPNHGDYDKMVPIATFNEHPLGMPHRTNSTSRTHFKGEFTKRADLAQWNNMHPYGNDFNREKETAYKTFHNLKEKQPIQVWPMYEPRLLKSSGKFISETSQKFINPTDSQLITSNYCDCGRKSHLH